MILTCDSASSLPLCERSEDLQALLAVGCLNSLCSRRGRVLRISVADETDDRCQLCMVGGLVETWEDASSGRSPTKLVMCRSGSHRKATMWSKMSGPS